MGKFRLRGNSSWSYSTPQEMYDDYKNKKITNIYDYQSQMIDLYLSEENGASDIALELPTGTGKTLIGLLIAEFRRRKFNEKVLYVCPNNQLVHQTVNHSNEDYGIKATAFTGKVRDYEPSDKSDYISASTIAVTSYSSLFNSNPFFKDADIIIFDDAHSGENYVASNWTVTINAAKDTELFEGLVDVFKNFVEPEVYNKILNSELNGDVYWVDKIPNIKLADNYLIIKNVIDKYLREHENSDIKYAWSMIKEHLKACNIFIGYRDIVIRPFIPPTKSFEPFTSAKQRIYMSATLGKSGELERAFGVQNIKKLPMVKDWENKTIGRRFFMFPLASFKAKELKDIIIKLINKTDRSLVIVNDNETQEVFSNLISENTTKEVFTAKEIERTKKSFIQSDNAVAIISNRFDGIDFPGDECRVQILFDLQMATHIQERFLTTRMASQVLFTERINTRLIQALGRCTRSNTDYAAICVVGEDLMSTLVSPNKIVHFNPEMQAELNFGFDNSKEFDDIDDFLELVDVFLHERNEWNEAEKNIIYERDKIILNAKPVDESSYEQLFEVAKYEIEVQYLLWIEDYENAYALSEKIIDIIKHDLLKGYLGFWLYVSSYCAYNLFIEGDVRFEAISKEKLKEASETTSSIKWFNKLLTTKNNNGEDDFVEYILDRLEKNIQMKINKLSTKKIIEELDAIICSIKKDSGEKFEWAHQELGKWMGYKTLNPKGDSEPDPIWILNSQLCIVSEDKIYEKDDKAIPTRHVREAAGHENWIRANAHKENILMAEEFKSYTVFISNSTKTQLNTSIHGEYIYYLNHKDFIKWSEKCIVVLQELVIKFTSPNDIVWRELVVEKLVINNITPKDFIDLITKKKFSELKSE